MFAEERQQAILARARAHGRVDVAALAVELEVTTETVRRDLTALERHGLIRRVHGGAIPVQRLGFEPALTTRESTLVAEKERIGKLAVQELPADGAILLDSGTTTARLAEAMPGDRELTVVTNSLPIAVMLASRPEITLLTVGGRIRARTLAAVDAWALAALADIHVDVAFLGTNGVSPERGLTTPDPTEAAVKKAMIAAAQRTVLLADHTKFGQDHLAKFGTLSEIDTVITDSGLDGSLATEVAAAGPRVVLA